MKNETRTDKSDKNNKVAVQSEDPYREFRKFVSEQANED
jgi:hypothetical protein